MFAERQAIWRKVILISVACLCGTLCWGAPAWSGDSTEDVAGAVLVRAVPVAPVVDGQLDDAWNVAEVATIPLMRGRHSEVRAFDLRLRAIYTADTVYFFAEWPGARPSFVEGVSSNRLTIHFDLPEPWPGARDVTCLVACHTAYMDERGRSASMYADTIPAAQSSPLLGAGGWSNGTWRLEWSRPLRVPNPFDVQFDDLDHGHPFFIKVFEHRADLVDPVSARYALHLER